MKMEKMEPPLIRVNLPQGRGYLTEAADDGSVFLVQLESGETVEIDGNAPATLQKDMGIH